MGYYTDQDLPYYWNVADQYVLFDHFFSAAAGGGVWNHSYWVSAAPGNPAADRIPDQGYGDLLTIFDRLEQQGISWKFYVQNYDPAVTYRTYLSLNDANRAQVAWVPLLAYPRFLDRPELFAHIVPIAQYYEDLDAGTLPAVSYLVPSGDSEYPPSSVTAGQRFVRTLHAALLRSSAWPTAAFLWTYDNWGGWYDHVVPPKLDAYGDGYRVPALLVSPYARRGLVDHTQLDTTSGLKFIEQNWSVPALTTRDRAANDLTSAFDFSAPARPAELLPDHRSSVAAPRSAQRVIYTSYGAGLVVPALLLVWAWVFRQSGGRHRAGSRTARGRRPA